MIPAQLQCHILPFDWEVSQVWAVECSVRTVPRRDFDYLLELPMWSSRRGEGMLFDLTPMEVITNPDQCRWQWERVQAADMQYPLDFLCYQNRPWILDGVHRLAKAHQAGITEISIRIHDEELLPRIRGDRSGTT